MNKRFLKFLPIAAALLITASCSRDDDGNAPASGRDGVHTVSTTTDNPNIVSIPFSITVGGKPSSLTKAQVVENKDDGSLTQKFSEGDVLIITGEGLDKDNPSILTISSDGIGQDEATFTGELHLADGASESDLSQLKAELANKTLENEGKLLGEPVLVSNLQEAFEKYGYLVADFTYDAGATRINLEQHTAFLVFDLPYSGAKVNVKIGEGTTPVFVSRKQVLAVPDGATVTSKLLTEDLAINLKPNNPGDKVDVVFDIKRDDLPKNCIPGLFSVSDDKQVFFSKGNLQYNASESPKWQFAKHQYDVCHTTGDNVGDDYKDWKDGEKYKWTDLFGWGMWLEKNTLTDDNYAENIDPLKTSKGKDYLFFEANGSKTVYQGDLNDLGRSAIGSDWTTFTNKELCYLFSYNSSSLGNYTNDIRGGKYGEGTVDNVHGVILLPDDWTYPTDLSESSTSKDKFKSGSSAWSNSYTAADWDKMEANGAVFLPAAGYRDGTDVYDVGDGGLYWSSSALREFHAKYLLFYSDYVRPDDGYDRYSGQSVRLVRRL